MSLLFRGGYPTRYGIVIFTLFIRLFLVIIVTVTSPLSAFRAEDTKSYEKPAEELVSQGSFTTFGKPEIFRTPGYPIFMIPGVVSGHTEYVTILLQILLAAGIALVIWEIVTEIGGSEQSGSIAGVLYAFEPISVTYSVVLLSETLFSGFMIGFALFTIRYLNGLRIWDILVASAFLMAATYVRPVSYYLLFALPMFALIHGLVLRLGYRHVLLTLITVISIGIGGASLWTVRNEVQTGFRGFSSVAPTNLYYYHALDIVAASSGVDLYELQRNHRMTNDSVYHSQGMTQGESFESLTDDAYAIIAGNKLTFAKNWLKGIVRTVVGPGTAQIALLIPLGNSVLRTTIVILLICVTCFFYILAAIGVLGSRLYAKREGIFLIVLILYLIFISGGVTGYSRFRVPVMPFVCSFAGIALQSTIDNLSKKHIT